MAAKSSNNTLTNFFTDNSAGRLYPVLSIDYIKNPNRFYAFPILGALVKIIMLIPVFIELFVLTIIFGILLIINSFMVLFTGKYWDTAYNFNLGVMRLGAKMSFFYFGLTNSYPGFNFELPKNIKLDIAMPTNPNRLFAIPLVGFVIRGILLIPYFIWNQVLASAAQIGVFVSFLPVLFAGRYPESTFELARDQIRVSFGAASYMTGLSDKYPSFWISMNHKGIKIFLIVLGALMALSNLTSGFGGNKSQYRYNRYDNRYYQQQMQNNYNNYNYNPPTQ